MGNRIGGLKRRGRDVYSDTHSKGGGDTGSRTGGDTSSKKGGGGWGEEEEEAIRHRKEEMERKLVKRKRRHEWQQSRWCRCVGKAGGRRIAQKDFQ